MIMYRDKYLKYKNKYLTLKTKNTHKLTGGGNKIDIILFKADWCGHCKQFKPVWENLQNTFQKKFNFITYDSEKNKTEIEKFNVGGFPTIMIRDNKIVKPYTDARNLESMSNFLTGLTPINN